MFMRDTKNYPNHQQTIGSTCTLCECVEREHLFRSLNVMPCNLMNGLSVVTFPCSFPPCYNVLIYREVIMYLYIEKSFQCNRMY